MNLGAQSETRSPTLGIEAEPGHVQGKQEKEATHSGALPWSERPKETCALAS